MKRLGFLCVKNVNIKYTYVELLKSFLSSVCDEMIIWGETEKYRVIDKLRTKTNLDEVIFMKDSLFGPFFPAEDFINSKPVSSEIWGIEFDNEISFEKKKNILHDGFIVLNSNIAFSENFILKFAEENWIEDLGDLGTVSTFVDANISSNTVKQVSEYKYRPYELLVEKGFPFLSKAAFEIEGMINVSPYTSLRKVFEKYANTDTLEAVWDYVIDSFDPLDVKQMLHLDFVVSADQKAQCRTIINGQIAVFAHIYYVDLYDVCIRYLKQLPKYIDIYISTGEKNIDLLSKRLKECNCRVKKVLGAGTRGRDAGALLVSFKEYIKEYDYVCFLHDKKSSGGITASEEGRAFMELIWDNMLYNNIYVENILGLLQNNSRLMFLSPPAPMFGMYLKSLISKEWTICLEETRKLAERIGVECNFDIKKPPFALGTAFWCKREAIKDLIEYDWKFSDFPEEPIKIDGEINHAIERIFPHIVKKNGGCTGIVYQNSYAETYLDNCKYIIDQEKKNAGEEVPFLLGGMNRLKEEIWLLHRFSIFLGAHPNLYIYGAGAQAKYFRTRLTSLNIEPKAHIVTEKNSGNLYFEGVPIISFDEIKDTLDNSCGVVLAMSNTYAISIKEKLQKFGINVFFMNIEE